MHTQPVNQNSKSQICFNIQKEIMLNKFAHSLGCHRRSNCYPSSYQQTWQSQNEYQESYSMVSAYMGSTPPPSNHQMMFDGVTSYQDAWNGKRMSKNHVGHYGSMYQSGWEGGAAAGIGYGHGFDEKKGFNGVDGCMAQYETCINMVASSPGTVTYEAVRYEWGDGGSYRRQRLDDRNKWQRGGYSQNCEWESKGC